MPKTIYTQQEEYLTKREAEEKFQQISNEINSISKQSREQYKQLLKRVQIYSLIICGFILISLLILVVSVSNNTKSSSDKMTKIAMVVSDNDTTLKASASNTDYYIQNIYERLRVIEDFIRKYMGQTQDANLSQTDPSVLESSTEGLDSTTREYEDGAGTENAEVGSAEPTSNSALPGSSVETSDGSITEGESSDERVQDSEPTRVLSSDLYDLLTPSGLSEEQFNKLICKLYAEKWYLEPGAFATLGDALVYIEDNYEFNALYVLGIAGLESGYGTTRRYYNTFDAYGQLGMTFDSLYASTVNCGANLRHNYLNEGRLDLVSIGRKYCPGTDQWPKDVQWITNQYVKFAYQMLEDGEL